MFGLVFMSISYDVIFELSVVTVIVFSEYFSFQWTCGVNSSYINRNTLLTEIYVYSQTNKHILTKSHAIESQIFAASFEYKFRGDFLK